MQNSETGTNIIDMLVIPYMTLNLKTIHNKGESESKFYRQGLRKRVTKSSITRLSLELHEIIKPHKRNCT